MSGELTQYQHDVDRTLDEMEDQITDAQTQLGIVDQNVWQSGVIGVTIVETTGSINTWRRVAEERFTVNDNVVLLSASINADRNNAFMTSYMLVTPIGSTDVQPVPGAIFDSFYTGQRVDTHNHVGPTTHYNLNASKTIAWQLPNGTWDLSLFLQTYDTIAPAGQDGTLTIYNASVKARDI